MKIGVDGTYVFKSGVRNKKSGHIGEIRIEKEYWNSSGKRSELLENFMKADFQNMDECREFVIQHGRIISSINDRVIDEDDVRVMKELLEFIKRLVTVLNFANDVYSRKKDEVCESKTNVDAITMFSKIMDLLVFSYILSCLRPGEDSPEYYRDTPILEFLMDFHQKFERECAKSIESFSEEDKLEVKSQVFREEFVRIFRSFKNNERLLEEEPRGIDDKKEDREITWCRFYRLLNWYDQSLYKIEKNEEGYEIFVLRDGVTPDFSYGYPRMRSEGEEGEKKAQEEMRKLAAYIMEEYCTLICDRVQWKMKFNMNGEMVWQPINVNPLQALMLSIVYTYDSKIYLKMCEYCKKFFFPPNTHPRAKCCSSKCADRLNKKRKRSSKKI